MRWLHSLMVIILAGTGLLALHGAVQATGGYLNRAQSSASDPAFDFTDIVTITVLPSGVPYTPALTSYWQASVYNFPGPTAFSFPLRAADAYSISLGITGGTITRTGLTIYISITGASGNFSYNYYTDQVIKRRGNLFEVAQSFRANMSYRYVCTLIYSQPYQFSSSLYETPTIINPYTVGWDTILLKDSNGFAVFASSVWLIDPRLSTPDLELLDATSLDIVQPAGQLVVAVRNSSAMTTGAPAYIEFYDQPAGSGVINDPLDHTGGWCHGAPATCPSSATFTNPIPSLSPGEVVFLTTTYPFANFGLRSFGVLVDAFGGPQGIIAESNETNNSQYFSTGWFIQYLTDASINGPTDGVIGQDYTFTVTVYPAIATSYPLTYTWTPEPVSGQGTDLPIYRWRTSGLQTITLTANNDAGSMVTATHQISLTNLEGLITGVSIDGATGGMTDRDYAFTAQADPANYSQLTYTWQPDPVFGQDTYISTYHWTTSGMQIITLTVGDGSNIFTATHPITLSVLTGLDIAGPTTGMLGKDYTFTAIVSPTSHPPLTYVWTPDPGPDQGQGTATATYQWTTAGLKTITLAVDDGSNIFTVTHPIIVSALTGLDIAGPTTGILGKDYTFTAIVSPTNHPSLTYVWTPDPGHDQGQGTDTATYQWTTAGMQIITLTVDDGSNILTATHPITLSVLTGLDIAGPTTGMLGKDYTFTAIVSPTSHPPLTYVWTPDPGPDQGQGTDTATYQWTTAGMQIITLTVGDGSNILIVTHPITLSALTGFDIAGATTGMLGKDYTFTAVISPTSHPPLTYVWAPDPGPDQGQGTDSATYHWTHGGEKTITLAINDGLITLTAIHLINLPVLYLPLISRQ